MSLEYLCDKLIEYFPQIGGYVFIALVVGVVAWKLAVFYTQTNKAFKKVPEIEETLNKIDKGFNNLNQILLEKSVISQSCYSNENSPRVINDLGQKVLKESGAEGIFEEIKDSLITELEKKNFDSLLELEQNSFQVLIDRMNNPEFKEVQNFCYEHPTFNGKPLTYTDILFVMSLKLRNAYQEKYPQANLG